MDFSFQRVINSVRNQTGGLAYHWRAWRYKKQWSPFCAMVEEWLREWQPPSTCQTLVLIGPSAGYTLPANFIGRFSHIVAVDLDVAAQVLLPLRFGRPVQWLTRDFFGLDQKTPSPEGLNDLFSSYPAAAFLFCNILGQIPVALREKVGTPNAGEIVEPYMKSLAQLLANARDKYAIASYHDRFSRDLRRPNEAIDHLTGELFSGWSVKKEFPWRLTRRLEHQIEFVTNQSASRATS